MQDPECDSTANEEGCDLFVPIDSSDSIDSSDTRVIFESKMIVTAEALEREVLTLMAVRYECHHMNIFTAAYRMELEVSCAQLTRLDVDLFYR